MSIDTFVNDGRILTMVVVTGSSRVSPPENLYQIAQVMRELQRHI
jgi:hypothetical protein